ncbi:TolC family protein [Alteromonas sp. ASW11-36]|uniref:TolC family protein n=1 Tax=Alteromonas arenosi TaxID=3055817 RepID=A0ABT7SWJ0_9ALTE|nr:TolC family protein [Alteromonas sp. ASW11-36]MDM7859934.1 TolC family protein [Alteromonas sp. ASW11-36]
MDLLQIARKRLFSFNNQDWSHHRASSNKTLTSAILLLSLCASSAWTFAKELRLTNENGESTLSLENAINIAQTRDDWLIKSRVEQQRLITLSEGANVLPDPTLSVGFLNLPTDSLALDQEPMTQLKVGVSQMFPRGDTLSLQEAQLQQMADIQPIKRADRRQKVALQTTLLWLDAYQSQASYAIVKDAEPLFDKLGDIVSAGYTSSTGKANQQDLIRAELELVRLQDRLVTLSTQQRFALSKLTQFLSEAGQTTNHTNSVATHYTSVSALPSEQLQFLPHDKQALLTSDSVDEYTLYSMLINHPLVVAIDQRISAEQIGVNIAQQSHKPQYGVNASYALRDDTPVAQGGNSRADFFSIGMSVSLPLFSTAKQDAQVSSSIQRVEITKTEKRLLLRELIAGLKSSIDQYQGASQRLNVYRDQILPQMSQQTDAVLNAYTNDLGDFSEVVRAKIAELDAQITTVNIDVAKRKALATIEYYFSEYHTGAQSTADASRLSSSTERAGGIK